MAIIFMAILGAVLGSFINLCVDRLPKGDSLLHPGSHCDQCGKHLGWTELVPVVSYLALRRRCRRCGEPIPMRVLIIEILAAAALGYATYHFGLGARSAATSLYLLVLLLLFFIDLEHGLLPDVVVYPAAVAAFALSSFVLGVGLGPTLLGGALGFGIMLAIYLAARGGMGGGDVKLAGVIGFAAGFPLVVPALVLAAISGGIAGGLLLALRRRGLQDAIPFGPFLAGGAAVVLLWGGGIPW